MLPSVAIILVNWNGKADTLACLKSLQADTYPNKTVFVVDNGSSDDSVAAIRAAYPDVLVLETGANLGFTGGNNAGIREALRRGVDYIFLLNNDTEIETDTIAKLMDVATANPQFGLLSPVIHYFDPPREVWFGGARWVPERGAAWHDNSMLPTTGQGPFDLPWASGCAMLMPADVLRKTGGFDDRFFLNWEDVDLSLRIAALGYRVGLTRAAKVYHKIGRSFANAGTTGPYYYVRNCLLLARVHAKGRYWQTCGNILYERGMACVESIARRDSGSWKRLAASAAGMRDHFLSRYGKRGSRRRDVALPTPAATDVAPIGKAVKA